MAILIGLMARFGKENFDVVAILGWIASTVTVFMFGSPLSTIVRSSLDNHLVFLHLNY